MKTGLKMLSLAVLVMALGFAPLGCDNGSSGSGSGGGSTFNGIVDLAVGDLGGQQVLIYLNVLGFTPGQAGLSPTADITLGTATSNIVEPDSVILTNNEDLIVCDGDGLQFAGGNDTVKVWHNYRELTDNAAPDITFTNGGVGIDNPLQCVFDEINDELIVADADDNEILLIQDFSNIPDGTDPAATIVTLDNATSLINFPSGIALGDDDLYVANAMNIGAGTACVSIYRDVTTLANADAPDVTLAADVSFFPAGIGSLNNCIQVSVGSDPFSTSASSTLFVTSTNNELFIFQNAGTLADDALPDAIFLNSASQTNVPLRPVQVGSRLFVPNFNLGTLFAVFGAPFPVTCDGSKGIVGFSNNFGFQTNQPPDFEVGLSEGGIVASYGLDVAGDALFSVGHSDCIIVPPFIPGGGIQVFRDAANLYGSPEPSFVIAGSVSGNAELIFPISLDARVVSQ